MSEQRRNGNCPHRVPNGLLYCAMICVTLIIMTLIGTFG